MRDEVRGGVAAQLESWLGRGGETALDRDLLVSDGASAMLLNLRDRKFVPPVTDSGHVITAFAAAALVPQSYAQGNPKTGVWQLRARPQDSSGTLSDWSNIVAVTVDLPLNTKAVPAQTLPPAGPIGGWFTASDQTTFNLPVWIS